MDKAVMYDTLRILCKAATNQQGNEIEMLQVLTQLPAVTSSYLPHNFNMQHKDTLSDDDEPDNNIDEKILVAMDSTLTPLVRWLTEQLKQVFGPEKQTSEVKLEKLPDGKICKVCEYLDYFSLLGGPEFTKEKIHVALSRSIDLIMQKNGDYISDVLPNLKQVKDNFVSLTEDITELAMDVSKVVFMCKNLHLHIEQQMDIISETMLERLSLELLTFVDALKEGIQKKSTDEVARLSVSSSNLFSNLTAKIGADIFLSLSDLVSIAQIIKSFLDVESSLHQCVYTKLLRDKSKDESGKKSSLKQRSPLPDLLRSSQQSSLQRSLQIFGQWNWQEILKDIGPLIMSSMTRVIHEYQEEVVNAAKNIYDVEDLCKIFVVDSISSTLYAHSSGIPQKTMTCFADILQLMKQLLPMAVLGCQYKPSYGLYSRYVDEFGQALKNMKSFLMTIFNDVPSKGPVINLHYILATCEDVCTILTYCASQLQHETRVPFQGILQVYKDLNNTVRNTITHLQYTRLSTYILQDSESHHFSDPREFNEGESSSYSIQMWNLSLHQLLYELKTVVSEIQCHKIFTEVFRESLVLLCRRYIGCSPSYNRTKQVCIDITAILLTCKSLLYSTEFHPTKLFPSDVPWASLDVKQTLSKIHGSCQQLLLVLYVVTGPLTIVHSGINNHKNVCNHQANIWLSWVHPSMFPLGWDGRFASLQDKAAVYYSICFIGNYASQSLGHCLYALLMKNCLLLKCLMSHKVHLQLDEKTDNDTQTEHAIFSVFSSCSENFHHVFFKCAFKTVRHDILQLLHACVQFNQEDFKYTWQSAFSTTLIPIVCKSMQRVGQYVQNLTWSTLGSTLVLSLPDTAQQQIVNLSAKETSEATTGNCLLVTIILIIKGLTLCVYSLPEWLIVFLSQFNDESTSTTDDNILFGSPSLHILVHAIYYLLQNCDLWEEHCGIEFRRESLEFLDKINASFDNLCRNGKVPPGTKQIQDLILVELEQLKQVSQDTFNSLRDESDELELSDEELLQECLREVLNFENNHSEAYLNLKCLSNALFSQRHEFRQLWELKEICSMQGSQTQYAGESSTFNPIHHMKQFNQEQIINFPWNLESMNSILSQTTLESIMFLIANRWEMKENALLHDDEQELVASIKSLLEISTK